MEKTDYMYDKMKSLSFLKCVQNVSMFVVKRASYAVLYNMNIF